MRLNWGYGISAVYALFATATLGVVVFAVSHPADLVSADYYARSLKHDGRQAAMARAASVAGGIDSHIQPDGQALAISLPQGRGGEQVRGEIRLYRASDAGQDRVWPLTLDARGRQLVPTAGLASGRWILQLTWRVDELDFYAERPVFLP
jgi:hypothetical protein